MSLFVAALGLMMIFEGVPYFCFPSQIKNYAQKLALIPDATLRVIGFFIMLLGLGVVYLGRNVLGHG